MKYEDEFVKPILSELLDFEEDVEEQKKEEGINYRKKINRHASKITALRNDREKLGAELESYIKQLKELNDIVADLIKNKSKEKSDLRKNRKIVRSANFNLLRKKRLFLSTTNKYSGLIISKKKRISEEKFIETISKNKDEIVKLNIKKTDTKNDIKNSLKEIRKIKSNLEQYKEQIKKINSNIDTTKAKIKGINDSIQNTKELYNKSTDEYIKLSDSKNSDNSKTKRK